ncbi:MAG: cysteine desulfurase [Flavobacteriales bacterium]|nr:cysteine desulfurase [Flavobacteriales bacterium]
MGISIKYIRDRFPILDQEVNGHPLVYFDNAATTQKPIQVIDAISDFYKEYNSNVHRGVHFLSNKATDAVELVRVDLRSFIGANKTEEIIFTSGTTESINLVAQSYGRANLKEGDEVIISEMEHHSNIVPWQLICEEKKATIKVISVTENGELDMVSYKNLLSEKTRIVAVNHVSNTLGTINPIKEICSLAHQNEAVVLVDGAQAMGHYQVNVADLDCDFYAFSAHKMYGPTGVGGLYGKEELLRSMPPYMGGGEMIKSVSFDKTEYNDIPFKFEAGTPQISSIIGFGACLKFWNDLNRTVIENHEAELLAYANDTLSSLTGLKIYGNNEHKAGIISFNVGNIHPYDIGTLLDKMGIAVRTGHHCTEPLMQRFDILGTVRVSFGIYNTKQEVDTFLDALKKVLSMLQ